MQNNETSTTATPEEKNEFIRAYEGDILGGLLAAAKGQDEEKHPIQIVRDGKVCLEFSIRPLSEEDYNKAHEQNTVYAKNKQFGVRVPQKTNTTRYRSMLIYMATVEADREKVWNNKEAWNALNVTNAYDLIDRVLKAGEKDALLGKLDEISGYDMSAEDLAKN